MHRLLQEVVQKNLKNDSVWLGYGLDLAHLLIDWKGHIKESLDSFKQEVSHITAVAEKSSVVFNDDDEKIDNVVNIFFIVSLFYTKLSYLDFSLSTINKGIELMERICSEKRQAFNINNMTNNLLTAYLNRGSTYSLMAVYDKGIENFNKSINIGEHLLTEGKLVMEAELAIAYMNRGIAYEFLNKNDKALPDKTVAIEILERLYNKGNLDDENNLALAYMNRGSTYMSMTRYDESLADCNKSIEIWERMKSEGKIINENDLAKAYTNKTMTISKIALEKNKKRLSKGGEAIYRKGMAKAMLNYNKKQPNGGKE